MAKNLDKLFNDCRSDNQDVRREALYSLNHDEGLSLREIGRNLGHSASKVSNDFKRLGLTALTKSEIQKRLLEDGKITHPTQGKTLSKETKAKIGQKTSDAWKTSDTMKESVSTAAKARWAAMSHDEKKEAMTRAGDAIREAAKNGSKLEKFLRDGLLAAGYVNLAHKTRVLINEDLEFDIYLPELRTVIEVDGPSHFEPIWSEESLKKNKGRDNQKAGLAMAMKLYFVRVRQTKASSNIYFSGLLTKLLEVVTKIKDKQTEDNLYHVIE